MSHISFKLDPREEPRTVLAAKGKRCSHRLTFNPSSAKPKETLYIDVPHLPNDTVLVPGTLALVGEFVLGGTKHANNRVVSNLGRCLVKRRVVKIGDKTIQDLERADLIDVYGDLWRKDRKERVEQGIQSLAVNKIRSKAGNKGTDTGDVALAGSFPKYRIPLDIEPLQTHGVLQTGALPQIRLEITLAAPEDVIFGEDATKVGTYTFNNIELIYQTIESMNFAQHLPHTFFFNHISHYKSISYAKGTETKITDNIPIQLKSFVGVLFLFVDPHTEGTRDSEKFVNPNVTKVEFDLNGIPNTLYPSGMLPSDVFETIYGGAEWLCSNKDVERPTGFFENKYAIFADLRAARDYEVHGDGQTSVGSGKNIQFRITRTVGGSGNGNCHIFILGDGVFDLSTQNLHY